MGARVALIIRVAVPMHFNTASIPFLDILLPLQGSEEAILHRGRTVRLPNRALQFHR